MSHPRALRVAVRAADRALRPRRWEVLALIGAAGFLSVGLVRQELRLPPHGIAQIGLVILGTLAAPALAFVGIRTYGAHPIPGAAAILLGTAALLPAIPLGLGWVGHGLDPSTLPRATQAFGAGGVISTIFLCVAGALLIARSSDRSLPAARRRRALTHSVAVHDVRPDPGDPKNRFEPYFVALCDCGWVGEPRETAAEAFEDARRHSPKVAAEIRRPVG